MGATSFIRTAYGTCPDDAYNNALEDAQAECGHQVGYSGDINAKPGFEFAQIPDGVSLSTWMDALKKNTLPPYLHMHSRQFEEQQEIYDDQWGPALCFEVSGITQVSPEKKYIFLGYAPD